MATKPRARLPSRTTETSEPVVSTRPFIPRRSVELLSADETEGDLFTATTANPESTPPSGSTFTMSYGRRIVKAFPITEGELNEIAAAKRTAAFCFTVAGALFGFALNLNKDMQFANSLPEKVAAFWNAIWWACVVGSAISTVIGGILWFRGHSRLAEIKKEARFD